MEASDSKAKRRGPPKRFRSVEGVRRFVARVLADLEEGLETDVDKARCMFFGAKLLAELITNSELEERLARLERRAFEKHPEATQ